MEKSALSRPHAGLSRFLLLFCSLVLIAAPLAAQTAAPVHKDVPYVPSPTEVVDTMLKLADLHKGDVMYDLGCGDGRIVIAAAQKYGARGTGIDIDPERIKEANENAAKAGVTGQVKFVQQNLFDADFRDADVVTLYLLPDVNIKLRPKLLKELKVGARIVSHQFDMDDWKPDQRVELDWRTVYMWKVTDAAKKQFGGQ